MTDGERAKEYALQALADLRNQLRVTYRGLAAEMTAGGDAISASQLLQIEKGRDPITPSQLAAYINALARIHERDTEAFALIIAHAPKPAE